MRKSLVRGLCAAVVLVCMVCGVCALGSGDSLITLSYLNSWFFSEAAEAGEKAANQMLEGTYDTASGDLKQLQKDALAQLTGEESGGSYSGTLQARSWAEGDCLELGTGSGILMLNGVAGVSHDGALIDVTLGTEVPSGSRLTVGHRYLVGEDTLVRVVMESGSVELGVQGAYIYEDGGVKATPFYDVSRLDWFHDPVAYVYNNELFSGMDEHHFGPYAAMNRAMLMTVLYKMAGAPKNEMDAAVIRFDDVPDGAWYAPYVRWGAEQGITAGTGNNCFSPEQQVTRQQVVVLLYSFAGNYLGLDLAEGADLSAYQDLDQASGWAHEALAWAVEEGVIGSSTVGSLTLSPQKSANRAEVATMLRAFAEKIL